MVFLKKYCFIFLLILFSLIIRIWIFTTIKTTIPNPDYFSYREWIFKSYSLGFKDVYTTHSPKGMLDVNQPPGTLYVLRGSYEVFLQTARVVTHVMHLNAGSTIWINDSLLIFFFRLPSIIADLLLGWFIYLVVRGYTEEKVALLASALYLLSPPVIYNSTVWGQVDSINNLFFYLSLFFLLKKKAFLSVFFYACSLFIKLSLLPLLPLYLIIALWGGFFTRKVLVISVLVTAIMLWIFSLPFSLNPFWLIITMIKATSGLSEAITVNAFNFWWFVFNPLIRTGAPQITQTFWGLALGVWADLLFGLFYMPLLLIYLKLEKSEKKSPQVIFFFSAVAAFASFLFLSKMHERYLYPTLPLLITWVGLKHKYWILTALLNIVHFLNLYIVWNPNLFLFGPYENLVDSRNTMWLLSLLTLGIFGFFYTKVFTSTVLLRKR